MNEDAELKTVNDAELKKVHDLLVQAARIRDPETETDWKKGAFERLSYRIHPCQLRADAKHIFVQKSIDSGFLETAVELIELGRHDLIVAACNFLGDFTFNSDAGSRAVLLLFHRIRDCFLHGFRSCGSQKPVALLSSAVSLCANIVATCPEGHECILSLVPTLFLPMLGDPNASDRLVGNTILLLANLSLTCKSELRDMCVADVLLNVLLSGDDVSETRKSVAESVIILLLGDARCEAVDRLMDAMVIEEYCIPILVKAMKNEEFRGMYPHLVYSARLFDVLAQSPEYAKALVAHREVPEKLLAACKRQDGMRQLESHDEGRRLAIEALRSFARFKLWPNDADDNLKLKQQLVPLLEDCHSGVREAAAGLWALTNRRQALDLLLVGHRFESEGHLNGMLWKEKIVPFIFPIPVEP